MQIGKLLTLLFACMICRIILFVKRDVKWWKAVIPGYNKIVMGTMIQKRKLGILNCIFHTLLHLCFVFSIGFELWVLQEYTTEVAVNETQSIVQVLVPVYIAQISKWSTYLLIALAIGALVVWCIMMWKFTMYEKCSPWWILLWACVPIIPYVYFAYKNTVVINGDKYVYKRVKV